uniref:hypothetical protein n=1 Tax=Ruminococcus sp. TaxID=41978 RepID=UPI0025FF822F
DDKLLGSRFYLTSKVIDETAVKAKNILNSNTLSFVYNASVEYLYQKYIEDPEKIKSIFREEREKFDIIPKKQKSLYITKKSYRMLMFLKRELYISRGFVMQIAIEQYYNYLCSDEYLTLLINKRNEVLKENSVCNQ